MSSLKHLIVIDPGTKYPEISCFNKISLASELPCTLHVPAIFGCETLYREDPDSVAGLILLGSSASVYDELDWKEYLSHLLIDYASAEIPILGICFGHQLVAHVFGGRVGFVSESQEKESGFRESQIIPNRLCSDPLSLEMVVSHRETVVECPSDFQVVATRKSQINGSKIIEMIQHQSKPIWGLQSHPESTVDFLANQEISPDIKADILGLKLSKSFMPVKQFLKYIVESTNSPKSKS